MDPGRKGPRPQEKWPLGSLCCAELTTSWTSCPSSSSAVTLIFSIYWGREGVVTSHPCPEHFPSSFSHQSYLDLPSQAASCHLEPLEGGISQSWFLSPSPYLLLLRDPCNFPTPGSTFTSLASFLLTSSAHSSKLLLELNLEPRTL